MRAILAPTITVLASTILRDIPEDIEWTPDHRGSDPAAVAEFAGRACYESWHRPNPNTATARGYIGNILGQGHGSVLEHASITLYIEGISRSLTHEFIRHRHMSYSQASQRFIDSSDLGYVVPPALIGTDGQAHPEAYRLADAMADASLDYETTAAELMDNGHERKPAREAARAYLPNMAETKIVVTGNLRAWRDFIITRGSEFADAEIRRLALAILEVVRGEAPEAVQDITVLTATPDRPACVASQHGKV